LSLSSDRTDFAIDRNDVELRLEFRFPALNLIQMNLMKQIYNVRTIDTNDKDKTICDSIRINRESDSHEMEEPSSKSEKLNDATISTLQGMSIIDYYLTPPDLEIV
jgi:hypothetical protein